MQRFFLSRSGEDGSFPISYSPHERSFARFSTAEGVYEQALSRANRSAPAITSKERPWWLTVF